MAIVLFCLFDYETGSLHVALADSLHMAGLKLLVILLLPLELVLQLCATTPWSLFLLKSTFVYYLSVCMCVLWVSHAVMYMEVGGQLTRVGSLLPPYRSQRSNSDCVLQLAWWPSFCLLRQDLTTNRFTHTHTCLVAQTGWACNLASSAGTKNMYHYAHFSPRFLRFNHVVACIRIPVLFKIYSGLCTLHIYFMQLSVHKHRLGTE